MKKHKISIGSVLISIFLGIYVLCLYVPFIWAFLSSFKNGSFEISRNIFGLPQKWKFSNYLDALSNLSVNYETDTEILAFNFGEMMVNSLLYALVGAFTMTFCTYLVAYCRGRYDFKFLKFLDVLVLISMTLPIVGSLPSSIQIFTSLGLRNNFFGVAVIGKFGFLTMYYFIITTVIKALPKTYIEAAEIDGANELIIFVKIIFPLTATSFLTIFIFNFISSWNDWQTPYLFLSNMPTVSYGLWVFNSDPTAAGDLALKICACFLVAVPVLIIFLIFHKRIMNGMSIAEGIKE